MKKTISLLIALTFLASSLVADAHTIRIRRAFPTVTPTTVVISDNTTGSPVGDFTGTADTKLSQTNATTNFGTSSSMEITKWAAGNHTHSIIKFTGLSNIPNTATVTSVTFGLWLNAGTADTTHTIDIRRNLRAWVETEATWDVYSTGNSWSTAGGLSDGNDRTGTASGQITLDATTGQYYTVTQTSGGLVDDVQGWISGSVTNNGWHLERNGTGEDSTSKTVRTREGTNGNKPYLSVTYTN